MRGVLRGRRANLNTRGKGVGRTSTPLTPTATCVHLYRHLPQGVLEPLSFLIPSLCARHLLQCLLVPASPTSAESMDGFRSPYLEWVRNALARRLARPTAGRVDADPTQDLGRLLLFLLIFDFFPFLPVCWAVSWARLAATCTTERIGTRRCHVFVHPSQPGWHVSSQASPTQQATDLAHASAMRRLQIQA